MAKGIKKEMIEDLLKTFNDMDDLKKYYAKEYGVNSKEHSYVDGYKDGVMYALMVIGAI